jgi:hypothetical protein
MYALSSWISTNIIAMIIVKACKVCTLIAVIFPLLLLGSKSFAYGEIDGEELGLYLNYFM